MDGPTSGAGAQGSHALASIMRGMAVALLGSLLGGGLGFVFSILMARLLAQDEFGHFVLVLTLLTAGIALGTAGADFATVRYVAAAQTPEAKRGAMLTPLVLVLAMNGVVALAIVVFAEPIATHLLDQPDLVGPLRALALVLPLTILAVMLSSALSGLEQLRGELARKVVEQGGRILLAPGGLALGLGLTGIVLGMAAAAGLAAVAVGYLLLRSLPRGGRTEPIGVREIVTFAWPQTTAKVAGAGWQLANVAILSHATNARTVALYGAAATLASVPSLILNSFAYRFMPAVSRLWEERKLAELNELLKGVTRWIAIIAVPLYAVMIALPAPVLRTYGGEYADAALALAVITAGGLFNSVTGPIASALIMTGRVRLEMAANVIAAAVAIPVSLLLTSAFGLMGAAASAVVYTVLMNCLKLLYVRRALGTYTLSRRLFGPLGAAAAAAAVVGAVHAGTGVGSSAAGAVALAAGLVGVYALLLGGVVGISKDDRRAIALAIRPVR